MDSVPDLPLPISLIGGQYLLFSIDAATYLRREHHICGVLIGSIPQLPQQNVFLGLPLELMPEEVRLLVEKRLAYVVDDPATHQQGIARASNASKRQYVAGLQKRGREAANFHAGVKEQLKAKALRKARSKAAKIQPEKITAQNDDDNETGGSLQNADEESLFAPPEPSELASSVSSSITLFGVTPATSAMLLTPPAASALEVELPAAPDSYPLFKHLQSNGYYVSPGLRFGCQYLVYPGDPLRFHSHFLASHVGWDEELDLMDIVGGGRLGTGVKKGYLIGGLEKKRQENADEDSESVRTFSIEWAGM